MADVDDLAAELISAQSDRRAITALTDRYSGVDSALAYSVQDAVVAARRQAGARIVGAKLGLTSKAKQRQMKVDEPLYGILTDDMRIASGAVVRRDDYIQPRCEPEIAFLLGADLEGEDVGSDDVLAATALVFPAIDVLDSRFAGYTFTIDDVIADNASSAGFTLGGDGIRPVDFDLRLVGCVLELNGALVATAAGAAVLGDPASSVAWMVRQLAVRGRGLAAGEVVLAGALTEAVAVAPGDRVVAHFDRLGAASITWA